MFKSIKEFFLGKPKTEEEPARCPYKTEAVTQPVPEPVVETVKVVAPEPVVETVKVVEPEPVQTPVVDEIKITAVTMADPVPEAVTITATSDTFPSVIFEPVVAPSASVKKTRAVKTPEAVIEKKPPVPAIKVNKSKTKKKK